MANQNPRDSTVSSFQAGYDTLRYVSPETSCPYLPDRLSRSEAYWVESLDGEMYARMLARGFRRSGRILYRPRCRGCSECRQLRVPVEGMILSRSLQRVWRRNADVRVEVGEPVPTDEKYAVYSRYLDEQHDHTMSRTYDSFREFLYDSPMDTLEIRYLVGRRLMGIGLADRVSDGLSSVYMYFDPEFARRSPGTFSILWEVRMCRKEGLPYYYLGFFVAGSRTMSYKSRFRPNQILVGVDRWVTLGV